MKRIVLVTAVAGIALTGCSLDSKEEHSAKTFPYAGTTLTIKASLGGLRVEPGTAGNVQVDRWLRGKAAGEGNQTWSLMGDTLRVSASCRVVFGDCGARYHVKVPPGVKLVVEGNDDGVILNGLSQDTNVSSPGPIRIYDASGALRINGGDDGVSGERLKSANVRARTSGGGIDLVFAAAPTVLDLLSRDGRVLARVPESAYSIKVKSDDGRAKSWIKDAGPKSPRTIIARSGSGEVRIYRAQ